MRLSGPSMSNLRTAIQKRRTFWTGLALTLLVLLLFWPTTGFEFTYWDDARYIYNNPMVISGVTLEGVEQAVTTINHDYWIPLIWLSYMVDVEIFGPGPVGFHVTNVLLHTVNALLLFLLLRAMTGRLGLSALTAALFAVHPMRAEPVAWVVERKGLLGAFFLLLALASYLLYTRTLRKSWYLAMVGLWCLSLSSKPAMVTFPVLLLIVDWWPLERFSTGSGGNEPGRTAALRPFVEKIPLLLPAGLFTALTFLSHTPNRHPWEGFFAFSNNAYRSILSYFVYLRDLLVPTRLAVKFYDTAASPPALWTMILVLLGFVALSVFVLLLGRGKHRPIAAGWLWYCIALFPVTGIVPLGPQWTADRFTYIPHMLLFTGLVWFMAGFLEKPHQKRIAAGVGLVLLIVLALTTRHQLNFWKDGITLATRSVAISPENVDARLLYADAVRIEDPERSITVYNEIIENFPGVAQAHNNLAHALWSTGRKEQALEQLRETLKLDPEFSEARILLAESLFKDNRLQGAAEQFTSFLKIEQPPLSAAYARNRLGLILRSLGHREASAEEFRQASNLDPGNGLYHFNLAVALSGLGERADAIEHYGLALEIQPQNHMARLNLSERLFDWGEREMAAYQYSEIARRLPDTAEEHLARGRLAELEGNRTKALNEYRQGLNARAVFPQVKTRLEKVIGEFRDN